jgi:quercetin dioxygenase-like cupin family protein
MNTTDQKTTVSPEWSISKNVLAEGDLTGFVTLLGPGRETSSEVTAVDRVLYVAHGAVTVCTEIANTILNTDQTFHVPEGRSMLVRNHTDAPAKFLTMTFPAKRKEEPVLVFPR